jgi:hypothetical protein
MRLDPGDGRIATARTFQVGEGGGEYNVARGLRRCFGTVKVNRDLVCYVDVLPCNEEDFTAALGFETKGVSESYSELTTESFGRMIEEVVAVFPNLKVVATRIFPLIFAAGHCVSNITDR